MAKTFKEIILAEVQSVLDSYPDFTAEDATDNILDEFKSLVDSECNCRRKNEPR